MNQFSSIKLNRLIKTWRIHTYGTCKINNIAIIKVTKIIIRYRAVTLTNPFPVKLCLRNLVFSFLLQATNIRDLNWNDVATYKAVEDWHVNILKTIVLDPSLFLLYPPEVNILQYKIQCMSSTSHSLQ